MMRSGRGTRILAAAALLAVPLAALAAPAAQRAIAPAARVAPAAMTRADSLAMRRAIDGANQAYLDAFRRGDAAALAAVYDPDAAQLRPGGTVVRGRAAIADSLAPLLARIRLISGSITSSSLWRIDDLVYDVGHYTFVFQPAGGDTLVERSRYLNIWKRQPDGSWRIWRDVPVPRQ